MRSLIVTAFVSADGVMEAPGGGDHRSAGWTYETVEFDPAAFEIKAKEQEETTALLFGRKSYEEFAPVWPTMEEFAEYKRDAPIRGLQHAHGRRPGVAGHSASVTR